VLAVRHLVAWSLLAAIAVAGLLYAARRPLLIAIGSFLIVQDEPTRADAIVVLSGSIPDRILQAVDLYKAQLAPRIILTQEPPLPGLADLRARGVYLPEHHEQNRDIAQQLGVPPAAISVMSTPSWSTLTEAQALAGYLQTQGIKSILLVTSKAHARRARMVFRAVANGNLQIRVCPSHYDPFAADGWWQRRPSVRRVVIEYGKLLNYLLIDRWRGHVPGPSTA
jgi:uncharacterized SAM-binding protein YcdF (DUF218 family)